MDIFKSGLVEKQIPKLFIQIWYWFWADQCYICWAYFIEAHVLQTCGRNKRIPFGTTLWCRVYEICETMINFMRITVKIKLKIFIKYEKSLINLPLFEHIQFKIHISVHISIRIQIYTHTHTTTPVRPWREFYFLVFFCLL